jgi:hypothetical protein
MLRRKKKQARKLLDFVTQICIIGISQRTTGNKIMFNAENASTIFKQLTLSNAGSNRLKVMVGGKDFTYSSEGNYAAFKFTARAKNKANYMKITLNGSDLYDIEFGFIIAGTYTVRSKTKDMYFEDMKEYFETETGLYLSF